MTVAAPPSTLPRLLAGLTAGGPMPLSRHLEIHGSLPSFSRWRGSGLALINEIERSGLRGRGGAAFPTATKMSAVAASRGHAVVVANGCEGEPTSSKDQLLLERLPHLVIDGALVAAHAVEAREVLIAVDEAATHAVRAIGHALRERPDLHRGAPSVRLITPPRAYVSGQEAALVSFINGGAAKPTGASTPVFERGVKGRPTLVDNVETLAHVALVARHGADWFRALGAYGEPGSTLVSFGGAVARPGVFEIELGASIESLVDAAGGATGELRAFLLGGYAGTWVPADVGWELALAPEELREVGATLGAGIVFALPTSACAVSELAFVARWMAGQSAGQCGPCVFGLDAIATALDQVRAGTGGEGALAQIRRWASLVNHRGACAHPDGVARFIMSGIDVFGAELADHARRGPCSGCAQRHLLPTPFALPTDRLA